MKPASGRRHVRAFTLVEVILALSLALGLLGVVLGFYGQLARLRDQTLADAADLAAVRLCMDRLATELRTASPRSDSFRGSPQEMEFVRHHHVATLSGAAGTPGGGGRSDRFPLRRIRYRLAGTNETGAATGVERTEEAAATSVPTRAGPEAAESMEPEADAPPAPPESTTLAEVIDATLGTARPVEDPSRARQVMAGLRHLGFRYWDGVAWVDSWTGPGLPRGVEISLATEPPPASAPAGTPPPELFRRVVALPMAGSSIPSARSVGDASPAGASASPPVEGSPP